MVFMGADNLPTEIDLSNEADLDIAEMKKVGTSPSLNIFVQRHGKGFVRREHIGHGAPESIDVREQDVATGQALLEFMEWAFKRAKHRARRDHSLLVLWGHAYRFVIGPAATRFGVDALDFAELRTRLSLFQQGNRKQIDPDEDPKLDIIGFDACDLATVEMAIQLYPFARYMLASQIVMPLPGWPYNRILDRLKNRYGRIMGPAEFGTYAVRRFCEAYHAQKRTVSLTLLDLSRAPALLALTEILSRKLALALVGDTRERAVVQDLFFRSRTLKDKPFVDVADLCLNLMRFCGDRDVRRAAERLGDFLLTPSPVVPGKSEIGEGRPFVVEHGRNASLTARLHGVSLYAPHVAATHDAAGASHFYDKFILAQETLWNELVRALALPG